MHVCLQIDWCCFQAVTHFLQAVNGTLIGDVDDHLPEAHRLIEVAVRCPGFDPENAKHVQAFFRLLSRDHRDAYYFRGPGRVEETERGKVYVFPRVKNMKRDELGLMTDGHPDSDLDSDSDESEDQGGDGSEENSGDSDGSSMGGE
eukprot:GDKI01048892.1.p1 GENE.GDKI01048892.1~~GDKI01048892.1.p1  ORF type:complete len:146 (-),score=35.77 GDKI01048892.1:206-643(-)